MEITFPGGVAVEASKDGFTVRTDQPEAGGGEGSAPSPFDLYLISMGTCAGFFAQRFCTRRKIDTAGMKLTLETQQDEKTHLPARVAICIHLPAGFPEKYHDAIIRATDQCSVKRSILAPPVFEVTAV